MGSKIWAPPERPLLLELLALLFVILAIAIPAYLQQANAPVYIDQDTLLSRVENNRTVGGIDRDEWQETSGNLFWGIGVLGLYLVHLYTANSSNDRISTSATHFLSPLVFGMITYYRLYKLKASSIEVVSGDPVEIAQWAVGIFMITLFVARLRMAGHRKKFKDVQWDVSTNALFDRTYFELLANIHPLIFPPKKYHVCADGILIEGWLYIMPIPFEVVQSVDVMKKTNMMSSGLYLASSARTLTRIQLTDQTQPVYISPIDRRDFVNFCAGILKPIQPDSREPAA